MQIRFEFNTKYGTYKDALNLPDDHSFTELEIQAMKQERVDNWIYNIENKPDPVPEESAILPPTDGDII